jgi:hypothetical protein
MHEELKEILASQQVPADLSITYDDMHGLWGGSIFTVRGDGSLERQIRSPGSPAPSNSKTHISAHELLELVRLLVEFSAWEQRTANSPPIPDERRAYLTISLTGNRSVVWERFNEMRVTDRLIRIKDWLARQFTDEPHNASPTPPAQPPVAEGELLTAPEQLPDLQSEKLVLTWDQIESDSIVLHGDLVIWRERTGWEVYARFEEIAGILKQRYGKRLLDIVPTPRSLYALYGDSTAGYFHVAFVRELLGKDS